MTLMNRTDEVMPVGYTALLKIDYPGRPSPNPLYPEKCSSVPTGTASSSFKGCVVVYVVPKCAL